MKGTLLVVGALVALGDAARAGSPFTARLVCTVGARALEPEQANLLDDHLVCTIRATGAIGERARATLSLDQEGRPEPATREAAAWTAVDGELETFELRFDPLLRIDDFRPCKDLTLRWRVDAGAEVVAAEQAVRARCKKPKKLKAKLTCESYGLDGSGPIAYPGKGRRPPLESTLTCWVRAGKGKAGAGAVATFVAGEMPWVEPLYVDDDSRQWTAGAVLEPGEDFSTCESFTVKGWITSPLGQVVWTGKLTIPQQCR